MIRTHTVEIPFQTRITSLATDTALGTATTHTFDPKALTLPENSTILFAGLWFNEADEQTSAVDFDGFRGGIQIDAVAFADTDVTMTIANTGDHTRIEPMIDVTSYFVTNFPSDGACTVGARTRTATGSASNVNGVACKLIVTYSHDDEVDEIDGIVGAFTKTARMGVQSHHTFISTSQVAIGTTGGTNDAPTNQMPILTGASGVLSDCDTILHSAVELWASTLGSGTDLLLTVRLDGSTEIARYNVEQALATNVTYFDRILFAADSDGAFVDAELDPTAAHAVEVKSNTASTFQNIGGEIIVTYIVDPTATKAFNSVKVPLQNGASDTNQYNTDDGEAQADTWFAVLDVQEPGPIVMQQSVAVLLGAHNNSTTSVKLPGQASARAYTHASSGVRDYHPPLITRGDLNYSLWGLMRGRNVIPVSTWNSTTNTANQLEGGYAIINYHSGIAVNPATDDPAPASHLHTCIWPIIPTYDELTAAAREEYTPTPPLITEDYTLVGAFAIVINHSNAVTATLRTQRSATNEIGSGWEQNLSLAPSGADEIAAETHIADTTWWWREHDTGDLEHSFVDWTRLDIETSRAWQHAGNQTMARNALHYVTHHSITYALEGEWTHSGSLVDADGDAGRHLTVMAIDEYTNRNTLVRRNLPCVSGDWETTVYDDTCEYIVSTWDINDATMRGAMRGRIERNHGNTECPKIVGIGAYGSSTTSFDAADPNPNRFADYSLVCVHSEDGNDVTTPSSWAEAAGGSESHQEISGTQLDVFDKANTNDGAINGLGDATVTGFSNNGGGLQLVIRGAALGPLVGGYSSPIDDDDGDTASTSTSVTVPQVTTTEDNCLLVGMVTHSTDSVAGTDRTSGNWTAGGTVDRLRAVVGNGSALGNGGGISIFSAMKHTAGATGTFTATLLETSPQCRYLAAIKGRVYETTDFNISTGSSGGGLAATPSGSPWIR